jgi:hypothetical protein
LICSVAYYLGVLIGDIKGPRQPPLGGFFR